VCTAKHALKKEVPPTALSQSALSELLEAFRAGDGVDLIRESVRVALQELSKPKRPSGSAPHRMSAPSPR
jgi:putative transposase